MMVRDILPMMPIDTVELRCNAPKGYKKSDLLLCNCYWDGKTLTPPYGSLYLLDEDIVWYEYDTARDHMTCWIHVDWTELDDLP